MLRKITVYFLVLLFSCFLFAKPGYVTHVVGKGETLYRISQQYKVSVDDILKSNPGITAATLKVGALLRIPVSPGNKEENPAKISDKEKKPETEKENKKENTLKKQQIHTVEAKETLYSIAKKYGVTVDEIKTWNRMKTNTLKEGMILIINPKEKTDKTDEKIKPAPVTKPAVEEEPKDDLPSDQQPPENLSLTALSKAFGQQQKNGSVKTVKGTADLMASSSATPVTYFAMHKMAPVGTILKIKNLENNKVVYAKVIGKLPELDENKHVMVRVSMGVAKALQMGYGKAYVEMIYAQ